MVQNQMELQFKIIGIAFAICAAIFFMGAIPVYTLRHVGPGKPHPHMLQEAMADVGASRASTVMIGDTVFDIEMARNAQVSSIGVSWGYHDPAELLASGAAGVINEFSELAALAATLYGGENAPG